MVDIFHAGSYEAPVEVTFAYLDDYRTATQWMFGLTAFEPVGQRNQGLDATFDATFRVKLIKLRSTVQVVGWEQDALIAFKSIKGFDNESNWRLTSLGPTTTKVSVKLSYTVPGGLAGRAVGRALEPIVALSIRHIDAALRRNVEVPYAQRP
jgi:uncharacterized membrane protein